MNDHEHPHHHGSDCDCGCNHSEAEDIVDKALIFSKKGTMSFADVISAEEALAEVQGKILDIASQLAVDGSVLGHIKILVDCTAGKTTISITRIASPDVIRHENWDGNRAIDRCTLSINILSLANTDVPVDSLVSRIVTPMESVGR